MICLYIFNILKYIETYLWPTRWFTLVNVPCAPRKNMYSAVWLESCINVREVMLGHCVVQVFYILIGFLSTCSISYWERGTEISTIIVNLSISFHFYQYLLHSCILKLCYEVHTCLLLLVFELTALPFELSLQVRFLILKSTLSDSNMATPTFLWLLFVWYYLFQPFIFKLYGHYI